MKLERTIRLSINFLTEYIGAVHVAYKYESSPEHSRVWLNGTDGMDSGIAYVVCAGVSVGRNVTVLLFLGASEKAFVKLTLELK